LADKFTADTEFGNEDSVRNHWNAGGTQRDAFLAKLDKVASLRDLVPDGTDMVDFALKFTLANPAVTCPIPGMKTPEQAKQNAAAATGELDKAILGKIDTIFPPGR
jgi:aryl-alcohol dehydrogenase-like predicted oxidoreductase